MSTSPPPPPSPPFFPTAADINNQILQPQLSTTTTSPTIPQPRPSSSSISSTSSSIIIVVIVIASAIIVSASIYLLIRCLSRRFHRSFRTFSAADDVVSSRNHNTNSIDHILCFDHNAQLLNSLPLFTFGSLTGNVAGGDCAVCLSKFEREDRLRLLPLCCHAFHAECIDTWLVSNQTCPLCRSSVQPNEAEVLNKIMSVSEGDRVNRNGNGNGNSNRSGSFRIELGSVSRRRGQSDSGRSYSIGSFEYIVDGAGYEVSVGSTIHQRGISECTSVDKEWIPEPPGENVAADVGGGGGGGSGRHWLRDYVDRVSYSLSSRTMSFRGSGRFFGGSSRRNENAVPVEDIEANRMGEEISELFRWLSGV